MKKTATILDITTPFERRRDASSAHESDEWQQIKASFALSGVALTEADAELWGRVVRERMTLKEALAMVVRRNDN